MESQICIDCKQSKSLLLFGKNASMRSGRHYVCKVCRKITTEKYRRKKGIQTKSELGENRWQKACRLTKNKRGYPVRFRGITRQELDILLPLQDNKCAICKNTLLKQDACVDHSHKTGKTRGILCRSCNARLGALKEDVHRLPKDAVEYLQRQL